MIDERGADVDAALAVIRGLLTRYKFVAVNEADLQRQVANVLKREGLQAEREVQVKGGALDIRVTFTEGVEEPVIVVLELKIRSSSAAVERQAQRYARIDGVDAVMVVTTSHRLAADLQSAETLGGKPFRVIALRAF